MYCIKTMETYCLAYKKNTANENSSVRKSDAEKILKHRAYELTPAHFLCFSFIKSLCFISSKR